MRGGEIDVELLMFICRLPESFQLAVFQENLVKKKTLQFCLTMSNTQVFLKLPQSMMHWKVF